MKKNITNIDHNKTLYIFFHVKKCAGTTIREHIIKTYKKEEILALYEAYYPPVLNSFTEVNDYIKTLSNERKKEIKLIVGHFTYNGIDKYFNKKFKYITFLRDPLERTLSHYNWQLWRYKDNIMPEDEIKNVFPNVRDLSFDSWFVNRSFDKIKSDNYLFRTFYNYATMEHHNKSDFNFNDLNLIKKILENFYFIGFTDLIEDFDFLYETFGVKDFIGNKNVSNKFLSNQDIDRIKKKYLKHFELDYEIYHYARKLNRDFKTRNFYKKDI